jgi:ABC-type transport system involved in multi-copper enzyme maturation permease subunit
MRSIWSFAALTLREAARRRFLLALAILTLIGIAAIAFGFSRLPLLQCRGAPCPEPQIRLAISQVLILVMFMFHSVFALGSVFIAAPAIISEIESGVLLALLPRPISRAEVVLGRWLGLAILIALYASATVAVLLLAVRWIVDYVPPDPLRVAAYLVGSSIVLMTLALLLSTRVAPMTGGIVALVLFGLAWIGGIAQGIGLAFGNEALASIGTITSLILPTDGLWRGAIYHLEPAAILAAVSQMNAASGNPFLAAAPPPVSYLVWCVCWVGALVGISILSLERRDL